MKKALTLALLALAFAAPSSTQTEQTATVYIYRLEEANKVDSRKAKVFVNEKPAFDMPESEFIGVRLPPGRHVFKMKNKSTETPLELKASEIYYLRASETPAGFGYRRDLFVMQAEQAIYQMRDLKPLQEKNVKDKSVAVTRERQAVP